MQILIVEGDLYQRGFTDFTLVILKIVGKLLTEEKQFPKYYILDTKIQFKSAAHARK